MQTANNKKEYQRPPVVAVLGHIDHGKSTLLDYVRQTNTTSKEAGGITQHVSAYETEVKIEGKNRKITFLDTPGHEAFCSIRENGAKIADLAILVVSAEDGVKPQTLEALKCILDNAIPYIIAINKIDKPNSNPNKVKQDLAEHNILVEGWGGTVPVAEISAKTGQGIDNLLEMITLQSDLEEFKGDPEALAEGFVIESNLSPQQGLAATLIIKDGFLETGMFLAADTAFTAVRVIIDYRDQNIKRATFSSPIKIFGWNTAPKVGSQFKAFLQKEQAINFTQKNQTSSAKIDTEEKNGATTLGIILKTDTFGSLDAVERELNKLGNEKISVKILEKGVGAITEKDIKTANIKKNLVLGFNVNADKNAKTLAERENIEIKTFNIIYDLNDFIKEKLKTSTPVETVEKIVGAAKILKIFSKNKDKQVVGGRLEEGEIKTGSTVKIFRREALIGSGKIKELQIQKIKTAIIKEKQEFGMMLESKTEIAAGDILKVTAMVEK